MENLKTVEYQRAECSKISRSIVPVGNNGSLTRHVIHGDGEDEQKFGEDPDEGAILDVIVRGSAREVDIPNCKLRDNIVGGRLRCTEEESV